MPDAKLPADLVPGDVIEIPDPRAGLSPTRGVVLDVLVRPKAAVVVSVASTGGRYGYSNFPATGLVYARSDVPLAVIAHEDAPEAVSGHSDGPQGPSC